MSQNRVLIVTHEGDVHADIVERKLRERNAKPFRINLDAFPRDYSIDVEHGQQTFSIVIRHLHTGDAISAADIGATWVRKSAEFSFLSEDLGVQEQAFAQAETEHLLASVLHSLECFWMSHPRAVRGSQWKGEQLMRAANMGFRVPRTLITNRPEAVRQFKAALASDIIVKTMSSPFLGAQDVPPEDVVSLGLPTTRLSKEHLKAIDSVRELPCLFQEYIAKQFELRVTIVGQRVFAAKIHSQSDARTATDFRDFSVEIPYEATKLDSELEAKCLRFLHSYGLQYGAIDLIVTPQSDVVFLENNPGGQFLFVEQLVPELEMTAAVADLLASKANA